MQVGLLCCHCMTWLNFPEPTLPAAAAARNYSMDIFSICRAFPPLVCPGLLRDAAPCPVPVKHMPRVRQLGSKPSPPGLRGAWRLAGAARNRSHGNVIREEQL